MKLFHLLICLFILLYCANYLHASPIDNMQYESYSSLDSKNIDNNDGHNYTVGSYKAFSIQEWSALGVPLSFSVLIIVFGMVLIIFNANCSNIIAAICWNNSGQLRICFKPFCRSCESRESQETQESPCSCCSSWSQKCCTTTYHFIMKEFVKAFRFRNFLPESCFLILFGLICGLVLRNTRSLDNVHLHPTVFFYGMLPSIVLRAGMILPRRAFFENIFPILMFAFIGTLFNIFILAGVLLALYQHGWFMNQIIDNKRVAANFLDFLIFSSINSATDPVSVLALFEKLHLKTSVYIVVFGESILNDAVAVMAYHSSESLKHHIDLGGSYNAGIIIQLFVQLALFATLAAISGVIFGLLSTLFIYHFKHGRVMAGYMILAFGYLAYIAPEFFHVSGIISCFTCAAVMSRYTEANLGPEEWKSACTIIDGMALLMEGVIFFLMGLTYWRIPQEQQDSSLLIITLVVCVVSRYIFTFGCTALMNLCRNSVIPINDQVVMGTAGLRGAIALGLVMALDNHLVQGSLQFVFATFGLVFVTNFVLGTLIRPVVWFLNIKKHAVIEETSVFHSYFGRIIDNTIAGIESIAKDDKYNRFIRNTSYRLDRFEKKWMRGYLLVKKGSTVETTLLNAHSRALQEASAQYLKNVRACVSDFDVLQTPSAARAMSMLLRRTDSSQILSSSNSACSLQEVTVEPGISKKKSNSNISLARSASSDNVVAVSRMTKLGIANNCLSTSCLPLSNSATLDFGIFQQLNDIKRDKDDAVCRHFDSTMATHSHQRLLEKKSFEMQKYMKEQEVKKKNLEKRKRHQSRDKKNRQHLLTGGKEDGDAQNYYAAMTYKHMRVPLKVPRRVQVMQETNSIVAKSRRNLSGKDIVKSLQHVYGIQSAQVMTEKSATFITDKSKSVSFAKRLNTLDNEKVAYFSGGQELDKKYRAANQNNDFEDNVISLNLDRGSKLNPFGQTLHVSNVSLDVEKSGDNEKDLDVNGLNGGIGVADSQVQLKFSFADDSENDEGETESLSPHLPLPWSIENSGDNCGTPIDSDFEPSPSLMLFSRMSLVSDMAISSHRSDLVLRNFLDRHNNSAQDSVHHRKGVSPAYDLARRNFLGMEGEAEPVPDEQVVSKHRVDSWLYMQPFLDTEAKVECDKAGMLMEELIASGDLPQNVSTIDTEDVDMEFPSFVTIPSSMQLRSPLYDHKHPHNLT